jgi:hypothetical protein
LSQGGEVIVLTDSSGTIVDSVTFGLQETDISEGRWPDAAPLPFAEMSQATPGSPNKNATPTTTEIRITGIASNGAGGLTVSWFGEAGRICQLQYKDALDASEWIALGPPVTTPSASASTTDPSPPTMNRRFYRVVIIE